MAAQNSITTTETTDQTQLEPWKRNVLLLGGLIGASIGMLSAYLLIKNSEQRGIQPTLGAREGFRIAVLAVGLIRSVSNLWDE
jgi:hypothetical protein